MLDYSRVKVVTLPLCRRVVSNAYFDIQMSDKPQAEIVKKPVASVGTKELFDAKQNIESTHTSELVIALCGPIGSPLHKVSDAIKECLEREFGYDLCKQLRLSEIIEEHTTKAPSTPAFDRIKFLISKGDELRKQFGASVLAELAISQIAVEREKFRSKKETERHEPQRVCHIIDSIKNQEELEILRLVYRDMLYFVGVFAPLPAKEKALEKDGMTSAQVYELIDQDSGEELDHGQTVRDTFPHADFFLRLDSDTDAPLKGKVERFLHLVLGSKVVTPSHGETAMYLAASASGNSACLSRQVGAALTDKDGEVISVGWNDVPEAGGNLYVAKPTDDPTSQKDMRCWNVDGGTCFNDKEKRLISTLIIEELHGEGIVSDAQKSKAVSLIENNSKVKGLIEFSRAIHAEMHAILLGSQLNGERVKGGKLYCTTYPCHSCARHIVAAGIMEVYYVEPYRKSLATKLHGDAITEVETDTLKVRILPFDGVAPSRYQRLFRVPKDSRKSDGKMDLPDAKNAQPQFDKTLEALPALEALVIKGLKEKNLIEEGGEND